MDHSMQMTQRLGLRLEQKLSPQLIQSMELLQLPMMELSARIDQEMQENPTLELAEAEEPRESPESSADDGEFNADETDFDKLSGMDKEWDQYFQATSRPRRRSGEESDANQALANTAAPSETLQEYLAEQMRMMDLPDGLAELAEGIVYNIDDGGYLRYSLREVVESFNGKYTIRQAGDILRIIQRGAGPPGVGARDITQCLLLQLNGFDSTLEKLLITFHLEDIQNNRLPKITRDTGRSMEAVKAAVEHIAHLNPRPGEQLSAPHARYIVPEMTVKYVDSKYEVGLQDSFIPPIRISSYYRNMLKASGSDSKVLKYVRGKIAAGNWLISSLEQRRDTLQRMGNEIVRVQKGFFEEGLGGLKTLRMQDVADVIGVHVATVSRAAADKYIDTPRGVYPLKFFFIGGLETTGGTKQTRRSIKEELQALIDSEDKKHPISDGEIVKQLKEKGTEIARRTVAKYRTQMDIPSSALRKEH